MAWPCHDRNGRAVGGSFAVPYRLPNNAGHLGTER
jgi:hypothetical protein